MKTSDLFEAARIPKNTAKTTRTRGYKLQPSTVANQPAQVNPKQVPEQKPEKFDIQNPKYTNASTSTTNYGNITSNPQRSTSGGNSININNGTVYRDSKLQQRYNKGWEQRNPKVSYGNTPLGAPMPNLSQGQQQSVPADKSMSDFKKQASQYGSSQSHIDKANQMATDISYMIPTLLDKINNAGFLNDQDKKQFINQIQKALDSLNKLNEDLNSAWNSFKSGAHRAGSAISGGISSLAGSREQKQVLSDIRNDLAKIQRYITIIQDKLSSAARSNPSERDKIMQQLTTIKQKLSDVVVNPQKYKPQSQSQQVVGDTDVDVDHLDQHQPRQMQQRNNTRRTANQTGSQQTIDNSMPLGHTKPVADTVANIMQLELLQSGWFGKTFDSQGQKIDVRVSPDGTELRIGKYKYNLAT